MDNLTIFTEFLLMNISRCWWLQVLQVLLFLVIYLGALAGNLLTVIAIVRDPQLHFPTYFLIGNLPLLDFGYISVTVPKYVINYLTGSKLISLKECATQTFLFILFGSTEFFFLVVMSYDRYVAICHPLHYGITVTPCLCKQLAGVLWVIGLVYSSIHTGNMFRLPFTESNVIHQFFCDIPQVMSISSQAVQFSDSVALAISACLLLLGFVSNIFLTVLKIQSLDARNKALSTCSPQIATFILFIISGLFVCLGPISKESTIRTLLTALFYTMVPPVINPVIFSLSNREIKCALKRLLARYIWILKRKFSSFD